MHLKTLSFGLAVALASSVTLAAPVDYKIDPTHTATVSHGITLVSLLQALTFRISKA